MKRRSRRDFVKKVGKTAVLGAGVSLAAAPKVLADPAQVQIVPRVHTGRRIVPGSPYPTFSRGAAGPPGFRGGCGGAEAGHTRSGFE